MKNEKRIELKLWITFGVLIALFALGMSAFGQNLNPTFKSVKLDSIRARQDTIWLTNNKGGIAYLLTRGDTLKFVDATGEKSVYQIGTGTAGINWSDTVNTIATKYNVTKDSIYVAASGTWITDTITKDTVYNSITTQYQIADTTPSIPATLRAGMSFWDADNSTFTDVLKYGVQMQRGAEMPKLAINLTGSTIPNGRLVYIINAGGETPRIALADNRTISAYKTIGMTTCDFTHGSMGYVTTSGKVHDLVTTGLIEGNDVYLGLTGLYTQTRPTTGHIVKIGTCYYTHSSNGIIDVDIQYLSANGQWNVYNYNGTSGTLIDTNSVTTNILTAQIARFGIADDTVTINNEINIRSDDDDRISLKRTGPINAFGLVLKNDSDSLYLFYDDVYWMRTNQSVMGIAVDSITSESRIELGFINGGRVAFQGEKIWFGSGGQLFSYNTFLPFGVTWIPSDIYSYSLYYDPDSLHFCWAQLKEFATDTLDRINVDTLSVTGNVLIDNFNATYSVTGDDTLGGSSAGNAIDIVTQYQWINCRTSANTWSTYTDLNFTYDNDTIEYDGTSSTLYLTAQLSLGGATQGYEFRWYNVTDGAALPGKCKYTPAAYPTPLSFTAKDVNADTNDRYVLQVRGLTAINDLLLYDGFIKITTL